MDIKEELRNIFEPALIDEIGKKGKTVHLNSGEIILDIGQSIKQVPLILEGTVKVSRVDENGRELLLYYISRHESCALTFTCCMQQHVSEVLAVAEEDVTLLAIPIQKVDEWFVRYPTWRAFVLTTFRTRFNEMLRAIDQMAFQNLDERLVKYLKDKTKLSGSALINLSHQQIADDLATSRVVISRLLKKLENDKKVILSRNQVKVLKDL